MSPCVEINVVAHEGGDEVVRVIVEGLHPHDDRVVGLGGRGGKVLRLQLLLEERVGGALQQRDVIEEL